MAKKINSQSQPVGQETAPVVSETQLNELENPTLTKEHQNNAPAPVKHIESQSLVARSDNDEMENQNADSDAIRKTVMASNPTTPDNINDSAVAPKKLTMQDIISQMEPSPEQLEKEKKRQRAMTIIGAISDVGAGISNMIATRNGSIPVKHNDVTRELDARYQKILDDRRKRTDNWDQMRVQAGMNDFGQRLREERENKMMEASQIASENAYRRELDKERINHTYNVELQNGKFANSVGLEGLKHGNSMEKTKYEQGQQNYRNRESNATSMHNSSNNRDELILDTAGNGYRLPKGLMDGNYGAFASILQKNNIPGFPNGQMGASPSQSQVKDYVLRNFDKSPEILNILNNNSSNAGGATQGSQNKTGVGFKKDTNTNANDLLD